MASISIKIGKMPGNTFYAKKGLKRSIVVYVSEATYKRLVKLSTEKEWSLQTLVRRLLDSCTKNKPEL